MERTLRHPEVLQRPKSPDGVFTFDLKQQGREQEKLTMKLADVRKNAFAMPLNDPSYPKARTSSTTANSSS